jgi:hypothetical protein
LETGYLVCHVDSQVNRRIAGCPPIPRFWRLGRYGDILGELSLALEKAHPLTVARIREALPMGRLGEPQEIRQRGVVPRVRRASLRTGAFFVADGGLWVHSGMPSLSGEEPAW